jgi:phosphoribosylanthranilate isomerase
LSVAVKICGLTDAAAVQAAVAAGADALGFVFAESVRQVSAAHARRISAGVPDSVLRVAVMLHPAREQWQEVYEQFRPDVLQTDAADFDYLEVAGDIRRWPVIREGQEPQQLPGEFVYEGVASGRGRTVDWQAAAELARGARMILAGGLAAGNVADAILQVAPWGVDVSSGVEHSPGQKDPQKIAEFVRVAKAAGSTTGTT